MSDHTVTRADVDEALKTIAAWKSVARTRNKKGAEEKCNLIEKVIRELLI